MITVFSFIRCFFTRFKQRSSLRYDAQPRQSGAKSKHESRVPLESDEESQRQDAE